MGKDGAAPSEFQFPGPPNVLRTGFWISVLRSPLVALGPSGCSGVDQIKTGHGDLPLDGCEFLPNEWPCLDTSQEKLSIDVMLETYQLLRAIGKCRVKPALISLGRLRRGMFGECKVPVQNSTNMHSKIYFWNAIFKQEWVGKMNPPLGFAWFCAMGHSLEGTALPVSWRDWELWSYLFTWPEWWERPRCGDPVYLSQHSWVWFIQSLYSRVGSSVLSPQYSRVGSLSAKQPTVFALSPSCQEAHNILHGVGLPQAINVRGTSLCLALWCALGYPYYTGFLWQWSGHTLSQWSHPNYPKTKEVGKGNKCHICPEYGKAFTYSFPLLDTRKLIQEKRLRHVRSVRRPFLGPLCSLGSWLFI